MLNIFEVTGCLLCFFITLAKILGNAARRLYLYIAWTWAWAKSLYPGARRSNLTISQWRTFPPMINIKQLITTTLNDQRPIPRDVCTEGISILSKYNFNRMGFFKNSIHAFNIHPILQTATIVRDYIWPSVGQTFTSKTLAFIYTRSPWNILIRIHLVVRCSYLHKWKLVCIYADSVLLM